MNKLKQMAANPNCKKVLRYAIYFGWLLLFLSSLKGCYAVLDGEKPSETCQSFFDIGQDFKLPAEFSIFSLYYFASAAIDHLWVCSMPNESGFSFIAFFLIVYLLFKSVGDRILPVMHPWRRDIGEILFMEAWFHWQIPFYLTSRGLWYLLPDVLLILLSETFYFWVIMLLRRLAIRCGVINPQRFLIFLLLVSPFVGVVIYTFNILYPE